MARTPWLDDKSQTPLIDDYAKELSHFLEAMADGKIEQHELEKAETRLVDLMKRVEPKLDDEVHAEVTQLLCEMSAYSIMQVLSELHVSRRERTLQL